MISQHCAPLNAPATPTSPCWQGLGAVGLSPAAPVPGPAMGLLGLADREVLEGRRGRALEAAERGRMTKRGHFPTERRDAPKATLPELPKPPVSLGVPMSLAPYSPLAEWRGGPPCNRSRQALPKIAFKGEPPVLPGLAEVLAPSHTSAREAPCALLTLSKAASPNSAAWGTNQRPPQCRGTPSTACADPRRAHQPCAVGPGRTGGCGSSSCGVSVPAAWPSRQPG